MKRLDAIAILGLIAQQAYVVATVPVTALHPTEPTTIATAAAALLTLALLASLRAPGLAARRRALLALFLGGMPIVYAWCAILRGDDHALAIEAVGVALFGGLAIVGYLRVPALLGAGIIAHGVAWDLWHHRHASHVPDWYSLGCLVADVGVGLFALRFADRAQPPAALAAAMSGG